MLDSFSIDRLSIEVYEIQFFRSNFTPIRVQMFELSFLITLNIYKDYLKGRYRDAHQCKSFSQAYCEPETIYPSSSFSSRSCCVCTPQDFVTKEFRDLHHVDELKNFAAKIFLKLVCQSHTQIRASIGQSRTWSRALKREIVTTLQVQLGIGIRVQLQFGIRYWNSFYL